MRKRVMDKQNGELKKGELMGEEIGE